MYEVIYPDPDNGELCTIPCATLDDACLQARWTSLRFHYAELVADGEILHGYEDGALVF